MSYAPGTGLDVSSPGGGGQGERRQSFGMPEEITLDYTEINSVPPLPLWTLLAADTDDPRMHAPPAGGVGGAGHGKDGQVSKTYDDLFSSSPQVSRYHGRAIFSWVIPGFVCEQILEDYSHNRP